MLGTMPNPGRTDSLTSCVDACDPFHLSQSDGSDLVLEILISLPSTVINVVHGQQMISDAAAIVMTIREIIFADKRLKATF